MQISNPRFRLKHVLLAALCITSASATAQTSRGDVVIMRRVIARPAAAAMAPQPVVSTKLTCTLVKGQRVSLEDVRANNGVVRNTYQEGLDYCQNTYDGMNVCQIEEAGKIFYVNAYAAGYVSFAPSSSSFSAGRCVKTQR